MLGKQLYSLCQRTVFRQHRTALPRCDRLDRMEAECGQVRDAPHRRPAIGGPDGVGCVLNQQKIVFLADCPNCVIITGGSSKVHRDNSLSPLCHTPLNGFGINGIGPGIDIRKYRLSATV